MSDFSESVSTPVQPRGVGALFDEQLRMIHRGTDRVFVLLMGLQWVACVLAALILSPSAWEGRVSSVHPHVFAAIVLGGILCAFPIRMARNHPGEPQTRQVMAAAQMLYSALLIHLTGGRIETHFHVFGSLAFLAFYLDWRVLLTASGVIALDHYLRGAYYPMSVFGVLTASPWRWLEHAAWVVFLDIFLLHSIRRNLNQIYGLAERQAELEATQQKIEAKVVERTAQLAASQEQLLAAKEDADRSNRAKSAFLANMSHELRTPLNAIIGFSELLKDQRFGPLNPKQSRYVDNVVGSGKHLLQLISDILDLSKVEAGKFELHPTTFDPAEVLRATESIFRPLAGQKQIELLLDVATLPPVTADVRVFNQILYNLLSNAMKFTPEGGKVSMRAAAETGDGAIRTDWLRVDVSDSGIGIAREDQVRIFAEFEQVDSGYGKKQQGTGLGLSLTRRFVEMHGGRIEVESPGIAGQGSTFTVRLPLAPPEAPEVSVHG